MIELFHQAVRGRPGNSRPFLVVLAIIVLMILPSEPSPSGQTVTIPPTGAGGGTVTTVEVFDWRWAFTQGGLTLVVLIGAWSYRKDYQRWADDRIAAAKSVAEAQTREAHGIAEAKARELKAVEEARASAFEERIAFQQARVDDGIRSYRQLETVIEKTNATVAANTTALAEHTTALALNTASTHRLSGAVERFERHK